MFNGLFNTTEAALPLVKEKKSIIQFESVVRTILALLLGFVVGGLVMLVGGYNPIEVYAKMFTGVFGSVKSFSTMITKATPIIGTGLSVAFAYNAGLFNIGAEGQFLAGTIGAAVAGYFIKLPTGVHALFILAVAGLFGGAFGAFSGLLKSKFEISEVISGIMLNWIAMYSRNVVVRSKSFQASSNVSYPIHESARIAFLDDWKATDAGKAKIAESKLLQDLFKTDINWGIVFVLIIAVAVWFILNKTTLGFKIKAVGHNSSAAEYAGINVNSNYMLTLFIAGALSGIAGGMLLSGISPFNLSHLAASEGYGFDGIAVALLGNSSPVGVVFAGILFAFLNYGGTKIQAAPIKAPSEIIGIMIGAIVIFAGLPMIVDYFTKVFKKSKTKNAVGDVDSISTAEVNISIEDLEVDDAGVIAESEGEK